MLPSPFPYDIYLDVVALFGEFLKLSALSVIAQRRDKDDQKDGNEYATPIIPSFFRSLLLDAEPKGESSTKQKNKDGKILEGLPHEVEKPLRGRLLVRVCSEGCMSLCTIFIIPTNTIFEVSLKNQSYGTYTTKVAQHFEILLPGELGQGFLINTREGSMWFKVKDSARTRVR